MTGLFLPADIPLYLALVPVVVLSCFIFTTVGFGGGIVAIPIAVLFADLQWVLPVFAVVELVTAARLLQTSRRRLAVDEVVRLLPAMALGTALGVSLLVMLPVRLLMFAMALFIGGFVLLRWLRPNAIAPVSRQLSWLFGALGGLCSGAFGAGGPPVAIYLNLRRLSPERLRATIATTGTASLLFRLTGFTVAGLYADGLALRTALWLLPVAVITILVAERIRHHFAAQTLVTATYMLLLVSAVSLAVRALLLP